MAKAASILILLFCFVKDEAQNLVSNGDFEARTCCPQNIGGNGDLQCANSWIRVQCSPDYFNQCQTNSNNLGVPSNAFGSQAPHSGVGYGGFYTFSKFFTNSNREYLETTFSTSLQANHKYLVSFYLSLGDYSGYATNAIGAYFSITQISGSNCNLLNYNPQILNTGANPLTDTSNWIFVSDTLFPNGGEQYMSIGNFMPDNLSDTIRITASGGDSYYYIDDVSIVDLGPVGVEAHQEGRVKLFPNPTEDELSIECQYFEGFLSVRDVLGKTVFSSSFSFKTKIDLIKMPSGVYFVELRSTSKIQSTKFFKK